MPISGNRIDETVYRMERRISSTQWQQYGPPYTNLAEARRVYAPIVAASMSDWRIVKRTVKVLPFAAED